MNEAEARQWLDLNAPDEEGAADQLALIYFKIKQQLFNKPAIQKLLASKINMLNQALEVEQALQLTSNMTLEDKQSLEFTNQLAQSYGLFKERQAQLKTQAAKISDASGLLKVVAQLIELQKKYAACWYHPDTEVQGVLVSQEPDPMALQKALQRFTQQGGQGLEDLLSEGFKEHELLLNEQKRLSLLYKSF